MNQIGLEEGENRPLSKTMFKQWWKEQEGLVTAKAKKFEEARKKKRKRIEQIGLD